MIYIVNFFYIFKLFIFNNFYHKIKNFTIDLHDINQQDFKNSNISIIYFWHDYCLHRR